MDVCVQVCVYVSAVSPKVRRGPWILLKAKSGCEWPDLGGRNRSLVLCDTE